MFFDPLWLLFAIPGLLLGIYAQMKLSSAYGKYSQVPAESGLTGAEASRTILDQAGLSDIPIEPIDGHLTDHYDPSKRALFLSSENFHGRSLAAVGVAAHEAGHALQQQAAYSPMRLRMTVVPVTQFASQAYSVIFLISMLMLWTHRLSMFQHLIWACVALFAVVTFFQVVTLPVEFDASRRAKVQLSRLGIVHAGEASAVQQVLGAAALTYVAGMVSSVLNLLYLITLARDRR